jgi:dTDP-4-amino-4,6-dideoxygalactose transaminase
MTKRISFANLNLSTTSENKIWAKAKALVDRNGFILDGEVSSFEEKFASYCNADFGIGVGSGCDALLWAMEGLGVGKGDEVITVANTYIGTVLPIIRAGAKPVLVDCDPISQQIDPEQVKAAITPRTTAIVAVHLFGRLAPMDELLDIAQKNGLLLLEDAAQAHGALHQGKRAGSIGKAAGFSFFPAKNLGAWGDGGAIVTSDAALAEKVQQLRNYGQSKKYLHSQIGWNSRLDSFQAIVLSEKLKYLDEWNQKRRQIAHWYYEALKDANLSLYHEKKGNEAVHHLFVITTHNRDKLQGKLTENGVDSGIHYPVPIHKHECFADELFAKDKTFPFSEKQSSELLSLPMHPRLTESEVAKVSHILTNEK